MTSKTDALKYSRQIAYSSEAILCFSYDMAVKYRDSPGVYVECGVAAGAQIIMMGAGAPDKTIYAFDSFEGIPLPSNRDNQMPGICFLSAAQQKALPDPGKQVLISTGATAVTLESFQTHINYALGEDNNVRFVQGWFEETVHHFGKPIAILRLDGDLYNSTYVCLQHLYPKVIKGGIVIIDDFALPGCMEAVLDYWSDNHLLPSISYQSIKNKDSHVIYWTK